MATRSDRSLTRRDVLATGAAMALAGVAPRAAAAPGAASPPGAAPGPAADGPPVAGAAAAMPADADALWARFCDALRPLVGRLDPTLSAGDPVTQVEGVRCLARLVALGLDRFVEHADPRHPSFYELQTATRKYLGDNPDQTYRVAAVDGRGTYRVRGTVAGAAGVEIGVYAGTFQSGAKGGGGRRLVASRDEGTLRVADDGAFDVTLGPEPGGAGHLQTEPDANSLLVRTYFWDRALRVAHPMPTIERLDVAEPPAPLDLATLARGMLATAAFVDGSLAFWSGFEGIRTAPNTMIEMPDDGSVQTPSGVRYRNGIVELDASQALVLELAPRDEPAYWSFVLQNLWGETPDWRHHPVVRNNRELVRAGDGRVRIVVAHRVPAIDALPPALRANWMDMAGHRRLLLSLRWRSRTGLPEVTTRVVPVETLASLAS
ncbi:MAG: DUF1214 domain-containing protein [Myxococcota bacterium]